MGHENYRGRVDGLCGHGSRSTPMEVDGPVWAGNNRLKGISQVYLKKPMSESQRDLHLSSGNSEICQPRFNGGDLTLTCCYTAESGLGALTFNACSEDMQTHHDEPRGSRAPFAQPMRRG
jgi:hypothetical protein